VKSKKNLLSTVHLRTCLPYHTPLNGAYSLSKCCSARHGLPLFYSFTLFEQPKEGVNYLAILKELLI